MMSDLESLPPDVDASDYEILGVSDHDAAPQDDLPSLPSDVDTLAREESLPSLPPPVETESEELDDSVIACSCKWNCAQNVRKADILCIMEDMKTRTLKERMQIVYDKLRQLFVDAEGKYISHRGSPYAVNGNQVCRAFFCQVYSVHHSTIEKQKK